MDFGEEDHRDKGPSPHIISRAPDLNATYHHLQNFSNTPFGDFEA